MIAIVNYQMGNLRSVGNAFEALGEPFVITDRAEDLRAAEGILIPGVGAFRDGMKNLQAANLVTVLREEVLVKKKPFFGVCLGMQLLAKKSYEHGEYEGLGFINATVEKLAPSDPSFRIPHMGWNKLRRTARDSQLFKDIVGPAVTYFVHSYQLVPEPGAEGMVTSTCYHGQDITATIEQDTIWGAQFHPEKSQTAGLALLKNFINWVHSSHA